jgi:hypothetical protein
MSRNIESSVILGESGMWIDAVMSWLDGRSFELLYRASRDGWTTDDFHRCCDNRGPTLVVVRCSDGFVFGGYAAASWNSSCSWIQSPGNASFLFTLKNPHNIPPTRYNCKNPQRELYGVSNLGPIFGRGHDLLIYHNACINLNSYCHLGTTYNDTTGRGDKTFTGNQNFKVGEYEVFAVK